MINASVKFYLAISRPRTENQKMLTSGQTETLKLNNQATKIQKYHRLKPGSGAQKTYRL
jgi:hypothetical protein